MNQYLYQLRPTRERMLIDGPTDREQEIVDAHFAYLQALLEQGSVLMAGRTLTEDESTFGIVVMQTESDESAAQLMAGDPAVQGGVMTAQLFPYRTALWSKKGPAP